MSLRERELLIAVLGSAIERTGRGGQAKVAKMIGYSPTSVCLAAKGKYPAGARKMLEKMLQVFPATVECPVLGSIDIARCAEERRRPFGASSGFAARLRKECGQCEYNTTGEKNASGDR